MGSNIELSILMPMYNMKSIAWFAMESLCRQEDVNCDWELIVCEEQNENMLGLSALKQYEERLMSVGCKKLVYDPVSKWINLSTKYIRMLGLVSDHSKIIIPKGCDNYSQPYKIKETYELFNKYNADMVHTMKGFFYTIGTKKFYIYDHQSVIDTKGMRPGLAFAISRDLLQNIESQQAINGNDFWLYNEALKRMDRPMIIIENTSSSWDSGLYSRGLNMLSSPIVYRENGKIPLQYTLTKSLPKIPKGILNKLIGLYGLTINQKKLRVSHE